MTATKPKAPLRRVVSSRRGPGSQRVELPNGDVAIVCGPRPWIDHLDCGHEHVSYGGKRASERRCAVCLEAGKLI